MTIVVNRHVVGYAVRPNFIDIGRPSKWANPASHIPSKYAITRVKTREEAIAHYIEHLRRHPLLIAAARRELVDKVLVCYCSPLSCHGDILARLANGGEL